MFRHFLEEAVCPAIVAAVWPGGDVLEVHTECRNPGCESAKLDGIFVAGEIAATAPTFISDAPILHIERFAVAALRAQFRHGGLACGRIAVIDPLIEVGCG